MGPLAICFALSTFQGPHIFFIVQTKNNYNEARIVFSNVKDAGSIYKFKRVVKRSSHPDIDWWQQKGWGQYF